MKILLVRTDRIGDLILSTPAIASFRRSFPAAEIHALCSTYNQTVLRGNPDVDRVLTLPEEERRHAAFGRSLSGEYDVAVSLAPVTRDYRLVAATGANVRVGYVYRRRWLGRLLAPRYFTRFAVSEADPDDADRHPERPIRHEVVQVLELVLLAGGTSIVPHLVLPLQPEDREAAARLIPEQGPVAVHYAERWRTEGCARECFVNLVTAARDQLGKEVVVTYGKEARSEVEQLRSLVPADVRFVGDLTLHQWAAVFERCAAVVTVDTGATHVAAATGRPTVVVFEHRYFRLNSQEWSPWGVPSALVRKPAHADPESLARLCDDILEGLERVL
ncbi:MAG TPA: glycosyltransferase family 9 protein [Candidatus Dormibacteraeota bacterium]|nr:glycosyltransferase family 9 protein [Candidatus Dormibacteraeota bacterium]